MDRHLARRALVAGLALGLLAEVLLDGPAPGINVPILVIATLGAAVAFRRSARTLDPVDAWLPVTALILAGFVAIRGDDFLIAIDTLGAIAFAGATVIALSGTPVTRRSVRVIASLAVWVTVSAATGIRHVIPRLRPATRATTDVRRPWMAPLARGLAVGVPLAMVFAVLFASADPIFRRGLDDLLGLRIDLGTLPGRVLFVVTAAWLFSGLLAAIVVGGPGTGAERVAPADPMPARSLGAAAAPLARTWNGFGAFEATVILMLVDLVVGAFVALQVAYLFGGLDTIAAAGLTYSDYARRGFFELVAAAVLSGIVVASIDPMVKVRSRAYASGGLALLALTAIVLASAAYRLTLYQEAYGWTELRFYVYTAIAYVGVALAVLSGLLIVRRTHWFAHALVVLGVIGLVGLNVAAPAAFVAERNLERVLNPDLVPSDGRTGLDGAYLALLPDDAIVPMAAVFDRLPPAERSAVAQILEQRRRELANDPSGRAPAAWNLGRERAREALSRLP